MSKTVQSVKNSLKFKIQPKSGLLTVRVGVKKYVLPVSARMHCNDGFMFLSFTATSEMFQIRDNKLVPMDSKGDGTEVAKALATNKRAARRPRKQVALPTDLENALKAIPAGYRLAFDATGVPRLAKTRKRRSRK